ncbi:MAG: hypothetical protein OEU92_03445 [Alphaproteobacteria bacterium]|nr:hypothetical protein [Alphaproteobacteria bacterium]
MRLGWIKSVVLPLGLMALLAACQTGPNPRYAGQSAGYASGYQGCGFNPCATQRVCPPGHILARVPYSYGGPGRYCKPYYPRWGRCCAPPPSPCGSPGPGPCGSSSSYARAVY